MGSEQSNAAAAANASGTTPRRPASTSDASRLQRGYTIAAPTTSDSLNNSQLVDTSPTPLLDSRPTSPPMSVCSDSDLPYISYTTDKPIGGEQETFYYSITVNLKQLSFHPRTDSPKLRNKGQKFNKTRPAVNLRRQSTSATSTRSGGRPASTAGTMVVVNKGTSKDGGVERDPDILRLQVNIIFFIFCCKLKCGCVRELRIIAVIKLVERFREETIGELLEVWQAHTDAMICGKVAHTQWLSLLHGLFVLIVGVEYI
jgi:hypothetical protein